MEKEWYYSLILRLVIICFLPYYISIDQSYYGNAIHAFAYHIGGFMYGDEGVAYQYLIPFMLFTCGPSIAFYYVISKRSLYDPVTRYFIAVFVLSHSMVQALILSPLMSLLSISIGPSGYQDYILISNSAISAIMISKWAFLLLAAIPFLMREVRKIESGYVENQSGRIFRFMGRVTAYGVACVFLAVSIYVIPLFIGLGAGNYPYNESQLAIITGMAIILIEFGIIQTSFIYMLLAEGYAFFVSFTSFLLLFYIRSLMRYVQGKASILGCCAWGLGGYGIGLAFNYLFPLYSPFGLSYMMIPLPITFLVGLIVVKLLPSVMVVESIWEEEETPLPEKGKEQPDIEPKVKVPVTTLLKSRVRKSKIEEEYDWDHKSDDVFSSDE